MGTRFWIGTVALALGASLLIAYLANLHWGWLYTLENAEHLRLRSVTRSSSFRFKRAFDAEIERLAACFRDTGGDPTEVLEQMARRSTTWQASSRWPDLLEGVYLVGGERAGGVDIGDTPQITRFEVAGPRFVSVTATDWLPTVQAYLDRRTAVDNSRLGPRAGIALDLVSTVPAIIVSTHAGTSGSTWLVLRLDATVLWQEFVPELLAMFFSPPSFEAVEALVIDAEQGTVVFSKPPGRTVRDFDPAEVAYGLVDSGSDGEELPRVARRPPRGQEAPANWGQPPTEADHAWFRETWARDYYSGYWQLFLKPVGTSYGALAHAARVRSIRRSFVVLGLIGVVIALIVVLARRAQRLAHQQVAFVASVSHELRTPIAVLGAAGDNLADALVDDPAQLETYGKVIQDETQRLGEMVENVLHLARKGAPAPRMARTEVDIGTLVGDTIRRARRQIDRTGFAVEIDLPPKPIAVLGNARALQSALFNLISNALKYGRPAGWLGISVRVDAEADAAVIAVADRGSGIGRAERKRLFEPFFRGSEARAQQIEGSGLGLALVHDVVTAHDGWITLDTKPGNGSTFRIHLPRVAAA